MTIKHIRIFLMVCTCGNNISEAARRLYMTQPSVSIVIREIERYYGILLFDRIARRLYLTEAGKEFRVYAMRLNAVFEDMERELKNWDSFGRIRVGASITIGSQFMPGYVEAFQESHPGVQVQMLVGPSKMLEDKLLVNELDLAFVETPVHELSLRAEAYMEDSLEVIAPAREPYRGNPVMSVEEFRRQQFLLREPGSGTREIFDEVVQTLGMSVHPLWEATSTTALINAAVHGMGITVVPRRLVQGVLERGLVCQVKVEGLQFKRQFYVVCHQDKHLTGVLREFMEVCMNYELDYPLPQYVGLF